MFNKIRFLTVNLDWREICTVARKLQNLVLKKYLMIKTVKIINVADPRRAKL